MTGKYSDAEKRASIAAAKETLAKRFEPRVMDKPPDDDEDDDLMPPMEDRVAKWRREADEQTAREEAETRRRRREEDEDRRRWAEQAAQVAAAAHVDNSEVELAMLTGLNEIIERQERLERQLAMNNNKGSEVIDMPALRLRTPQY
jgi:hypothetical protein